MVCTFCSPLKSKTFKRNDGTQDVMETFEVRFTDGLDTILAETSKVATSSIKTISLNTGSAYPCLTLLPKDRFWVLLHHKTA